MKYRLEAKVKAMTADMELHFRLSSSLSGANRGATT
jgi:hypothetical protein